MLTAANICNHMKGDRAALGPCQRNTTLVHTHWVCIWLILHHTVQEQNKINDRLQHTHFLAVTLSVRPSVPKRRLRLSCTSLGSSPLLCEEPSFDVLLGRPLLPLLGGVQFYVPLRIFSHSYCDIRQQH
jgi:hypothetical protein